ncbi:hypothetical protein MNBD_ALPHA12-953 [hydrothermal vent metagenome]|uniref:Protein YcaR in KDO2-Lipid A biosynthesis cluster n=1 Tax=hydrothermal vent metagenome TaxID=652676 RepID=A0A3B0UR32_9ZZZZ
MNKTPLTEITRSASGSQMLDPHVIEMLVCPLTKTQLTLNEKKTELISRAARVAFPLVKGVALLSLGEARTLGDEEVDRLK